MFSTTIHNHNKSVDSSDFHLVFLVICRNVFAPGLAGRTAPLCPGFYVSLLFGVWQFPQHLCNTRVHKPICRIEWIFWGKIFLFFFFVKMCLTTRRPQRAPFSLLVGQHCSVSVMKFYFLYWWFVLPVNSGWLWLKLFRRDTYFRPPVSSSPEGK